MEQGELVAFAIGIQQAQCLIYPGIPSLSSLFHLAVADTFLALVLFTCIRLPDIPITFVVEAVSGIIEEGFYLHMDGAAA